MDSIPRSGEHHAKKKRSRLGCRNCRARKVKCDERSNGCGNCERLRLDCQPESQDTLPSQSSAPPRRPRTYRACRSCRTARTKCSGERPTCATCRRGNLQCSFENTARGRSGHPSRTPSPNAASGTQNESAASPAAEPSITTRNDGARLSWLDSSELPNAKQIRVLLTHYFRNFHPLRCFAFIHKPSFLQRLDEEFATRKHESALLYIMCSIGALFHALDYSETIEQLPPKQILSAGKQWAKTAQSLLLQSIDKISVERLMTAQLLYDYALRMGNFVNAFMLCGLMVRMSQALQINLEYSTDIVAQCDGGALSLTARESRRRLMWSCYIADALCGSGVDQLTLIDDRDLKIQLPCDEQAFLHQRPCITQLLNQSTLSFISPELVSLYFSNETSLPAYFIQHVEIRKRILKYIKHLDKAAAPWLPDSEFAQFVNELQSWYDTLPPHLRFTSDALYVQKESNHEGALVLLHCAYNQTLCDLYRIAAPKLYQLRSAFYFPPEQDSFLRELQWSLFKAATTLAAIIAEGMRHGPATISDTWLPSITYDSNRIMLYYLTTTFDPNDQTRKDLVLNTVPYLQSNVQALKIMSCTNVIADAMYHAAESMLRKLGVESSNIQRQPHIVLDDPYLEAFGPGRSSESGTPLQAAPDYVLNPLSIFRMARNDIPERHAPESIHSETSPLHSTPSFGEMWTSPRLSTQPTVVSDPIQFFATYPNAIPTLGWDWQPMETAIGSGMDSNGLLPSLDSSHIADFSFL